MFAQFLPDADRVPTTRSDTPRSSDRADRTVTDARAGERQAERTQPSAAREPKGTQQSDPDKNEAEQTEAPVPSQQADTLATDETVVAVVTPTPDVAAPPADPAITGTSIAISAETAPATTEALPTEPIVGAKPAASGPEEVPSSTQQAAAVPKTAPTPVTEPAAEQPAVNTGAAGNAQVEKQPDLRSSPDRLPSGEQTAPAQTTAANAPADKPESNVRSATQSGDAPEAPTPTPAAKDREPGNPTIDAPKVTKPAPDAPEFGKPGAANDAQAGKSGDLPVDRTEKPAAVLEDAVELLPRDSLVRPDKVNHQNTAAKAANDPAAAPTYDEAGKLPVTAIEERPRKSNTARETAETKSLRTHPQAEFRPLIVDPVRAEFRMTEVKLAQPIELSVAALPSAHAAHSAAATIPTPAQTAAPAPVPIEGIAVAIVNNAQGGRNRFEIRLDPPELGRIDVRLHIDSKGQVTSHLIVDRVETLDLLRRDAADLERSLQQAGLKTSDSGLQFSLRDQSPNGDNQGRGHDPAAYVIVPDTEPAADIALRGYLRAGEGGGLDIRV
jgi:chemotaxis protein MotD